jgi:hypothetical protein
MGPPQNEDGCKRQAAEEKRAEQIERRRRNHDGGEKQQCKWIFDPAGEEQQRRQLQDVIGEEGRRFSRTQAPRGRVCNRKDDVHHRTCRHRRRGQQEREVEIEHQANNQQSHGLTHDRKPAQIVQGAQPNLAAC